MAALDSFTTNPIRVDLSDATARIILANSSIRRKITKIVGNAVGTAGTVRVKLFHNQPAGTMVYHWWINPGAVTYRRASDDMDMWVNELWFAGSAVAAANSILLVYFE